MKEYTITPRNLSRRQDLTLRDAEAHVDSWIAEAAENGFAVSRDALMHNFRAWMLDFKSGFRDEQNHTYVFSPCGCNPLSFNLTMLEDKHASWQLTYTA